MSGTAVDPQPTKPAAVMRANVWELGSSTGQLRAAASLWTTLHGDVASEQSTFSAKVSATMPHWKAENGEDFAHSYAAAQSGALTDTAGQCTGVAAALDALADGLDGVQNKLDASLARITGAMPHENIGLFGIDPVIVFHPEDAGDVELIDTEVAAATKLQDDAKDLVDTCNGALNKIPEAFLAITTGWKGEEDGSSNRWTKHPTGGSSYRSVQTFGSTTVVQGNNQDEHVRIEIDPKTGETVLIFSSITQVNKGTSKDPDMHWEYKEEQRIRIPAGQEVVLNTGDGNDQVEVPKGVNVKLRVVLGSGNNSLAAREADDRIEAFGGVDDDRITTGHGSDFVSGGAGDDYVDGGAGADQLSGGSGNDAVYGLDGNDTIFGGEGVDFIDGGSDDDTAFGGAGNDVVGGGRDNDRLYGGDGDDHLYGGHGTDVADGGVTRLGGRTFHDEDEVVIGKDDTSLDDSDKVITLEYNGDDGGFIEVKGSPEFQARVNSDLEFLRSTPTGQAMLKKLTELHNDEDKNPWWFGKQHRSYVIQEFDRTAAYDNGYESSGDDSHTITYKPEWTTLDGDPSGDYHDTPPLVVLYHEMGHSYQFMSGTAAEGRTKQGTGSVNSVERQNVGLSWSENDRSGDEEGLDPDHEPDPDQAVYRENGLREDLGLDDRTQY